MDGDKRNVTEVPMAHRETEGTEVTQCYCGADGTKTNGWNGDKRNITEVRRWHKEKRKERR